jgi:transcriptional regulator with XRE-family HTH domain
MTNVGEKIRGIRTLKGLSQENLAMMLDLSLPAYADIERGKKDVTIKRLEQIAEKLGVSLNDILSFGDRVSNFFDQCNGASVATGTNGNSTANNYDSRELQYELEKAQLREAKLQSDLKLCQVEKEKAELEVKYWREKYEKL